MAAPGERPRAGDIPEPVAQNIVAIRQWRERRRSSQSTSDKLASAISRFAGSMPFVYIHILLFGGWIAANLGWIPGAPQWDPSLVMLAMVASVEAIFLSAFVLINQNQMTAEAEQRAELDLQVSLLAERETTRILTLVQAIASQMGVEAGQGGDLDELRRDTDPDAILDAVSESRPEGSGRR
jgi:uncharacterized membrane protein